MSDANFQVRRATVEDLPTLRTLWQAAGLNPADLEKRLTEFQVIESSTGQAVGAVGVQIAGKAARLHSEVFASGDRADDFRARLWNRIHTVAINHGLTRLWTQERAPYWHQNGFVAASGDTLQKLPALLGTPQGAWLTLQLKEEGAPATPSVDHEFELFKQAQLQERQQIMKQARAMKVLALIVSVIVLIIIGIAALVFLTRKGNRPASSPPPPAVQPGR